MENDVEQAIASNMEELNKARTPNKGKDIDVGSASNMESDIEQARASNMEEDKASAPNKGKDFDVGSVSDIEMAIKPLRDMIGKGLAPWEYTRICDRLISSRSVPTSFVL